MTSANKFAFVLMCAIIVATTIAYGAVHQPIIALFYIAVALMLVLWAVDGVKSGAMRYSLSPLQIPLLGAAIYGFIQVFPFGSVADIGGIAGIPRTISLDPFATQVSALHFLALFIFLAVSIVLLDSASRLRRLVTVLTIFGSAYAFFAIIQSFLSPDKIFGIYERPFAATFGSFVSRNNFAAYIEMAASLPLGLLFAGAVSKDKRLLYITAIALMGISLLLSGSRGGLVAFLAGIVFLLILSVGAKRRGSMALKISLTLLLVVAIVGGGVFIGQETTLTRITETEEAKELTTNRAHIWRVTTEVIANNLPLGTGLGAFGVSFTRFDTHSGLERVEQAHNDYLQAMADAGIVGLGLGLLFLYFLFRAGLDAIRTKNTFRRGIAIGALTGIFAVLVHSIFDFVLHTTAISVLFLILIALLVASRSRYDDDIIEFDEVHARKHRSASVSSISSVRRGG